MKTKKRKCFTCEALKAKTAEEHHQAFLTSEVHVCDDCRPLTKEQIQKFFPINL